MRRLLVLLPLVFVQVAWAQNTKILPASLECTDTAIAFDFTREGVGGDVVVDGAVRAGLTAYINGFLEQSRSGVQLFAATDGVHGECTVSPEVWCEKKWCLVHAWELKLEALNGMLAAPLSNDRLNVYVVDGAAMGVRSSEVVESVEPGMLLAEGVPTCIKRGDWMGGGSQTGYTLAVYYLLELRLNDAFEGGYMSSVYPSYRIETVLAGIPDVAVYCDSALASF